MQTPSSLISCISPGGSLSGLAAAELGHCSLMMANRGDKDL